MSEVADCLFCRFVSGELQPDVVHETKSTLAFRDINPQAPTHVLVIPKAHHPDVVTLGDRAPDELADLFDVVRQVVEAEQLGEGYRVVFNTGPGAGQTVSHAHGHVLGGRVLTWPPG